VNEGAARLSSGSSACYQLENGALQSMTAFLRRLSLRKARTNSVPHVNVDTRFSSTRTSGSLPPAEEVSSPTSIPDATRTAQNVLKFALQTLSSVSANIPMCTPLSGIIDPLLSIADRIEQTSANAQGLVELAARIELLTPVVSDLAENNPNQGQSIVDTLQRELQSIKKDLDAASSKGQLNQFFNSPDYASSLAKHNTTLAQMIADSTLATVREVLKTLHEHEAKRLRLLESSPSEVNELGDITGGLGGTGSSARIGGEGGEGEGPQLDLDPDERWKIGNISGGTGGTGGMGVEVGGKGGPGKAPQISVRRNRNVVSQP